MILSRRAWRASWLALAAAFLAGGLAVAEPSGETAARAGTTTGTPPAPTRRTSSTAKSRASATPKKSGVARTAPAADSTSGRRRLHEIHIEGEIPVPQVLFITARDQRRFLDFQHRHYLRTCRQIAEATAYPGRVVVVESPGTPVPKTPR